MQIFVGGKFTQMIWVNIPPDEWIFPPMSKYFPRLKDLENFDKFDCKFECTGMAYFKEGGRLQNQFLPIAPIMISLDRHHISLFFFLILSLIIIPHHQIQFFAQISINSRPRKFRKNPTSQCLKYSYTVNIPSICSLITTLSYNKNMPSSNSHQIFSSKQRIITALSPRNVKSSCAHISPTTDKYS